MRIADVSRGQIVRLAGSGPAVVEAIWIQTGEYHGRFRCQDGLVVQLEQVEEFMIQPVKVSEYVVAAND